MEVVWLSLETLLTWWLVYSLALVMVCGAVHPNFIVIVIDSGGGGSTIVVDCPQFGPGLVRPLFADPRTSPGPDSDPSTAVYFFFF